MALTRKKKIIIAVSAVAVLALIIIISVFASRKDEAEVTTVKLEVKPELRQTVTASGEVRPVRYIKLTSEVPGRIEESAVAAGASDGFGDGCAPGCVAFEKRRHVDDGQRSGTHLFSPAGWAECVLWKRAKHCIELNYLGSMWERKERD